MVRYSPPPSLRSHRFLIILGCALWIGSLFTCAYIVIGEERERRAWIKASTPITHTTMSLPDDQVCEVDGHIVNCGPCGKCSNRQDIKSYEETTTSLVAGTMKYCANIGIVFGWNRAFRCLQNRVRMTDDCTNCWILNAECHQSRCFHTCLKRHFFSFLPSMISSSDVTDRCVECKEGLCGPFLDQCAGATRRRVDETCSKVDWDYIRGSKPEASMQGSDELWEVNMCSEWPLFRNWDIYQGWLGLITVEAASRKKLIYGSFKTANLYHEESGMMMSSWMWMVPECHLVAISNFLEMELRSWWFRSALAGNIFL